ncbi:MAG TPA: VOC family protein [Roseiflexaceae bacterium]|nr:VOC family protein [Roseiflexaceae bacterium]
MEILDTHHIAIYTAQFERLRAFYTGTLGLPEVGGFEGYNIIFIAAGSTAIELIEHNAPGVPSSELGWNHLALEVADIDAACAELQGRGVFFHEPPFDFPADRPRARVAFFKDPDGNVLELIQMYGERYPSGK